MNANDPAREATGSDVNRRLDEERIRRVAALVGAPPDTPVARAAIERAQRVG